MREFSENFVQMYGGPLSCWKEEVVAAVGSGAAAAGAISLSARAAGGEGGEVGTEPQVQTLLCPAQT